MGKYHDFSDTTLRVIELLKDANLTYPQIGEIVGLKFRRVGAIYKQAKKKGIVLPERKRGRR